MFMDAFIKLDTPKQRNEKYMHIYYAKSEDT
jgi:hypothetical protein